jgi:hypothetical protein
MKGTSNRKEIFEHVGLLATWKIKSIQVKSKDKIIGEIRCRKVEYGEYEVGFRLADDYAQDKHGKNYPFIDDLLCRISKILDTKYYKPFSEDKTGINGGGSLISKNIAVCTKLS